MISNDYKINLQGFQHILASKRGKGDHFYQKRGLKWTMSKYTAPSFPIYASKFLKFTTKIR